VRLSSSAEVDCLFRVIVYTSSRLSFSDRRNLTIDHTSSRSTILNIKPTHRHLIDKPPKHRAPLNRVHESGQLHSQKAPNNTQTSRIASQTCPPPNQPPSSAPSSSPPKSSSNYPKATAAAPYNATTTTKASSTYSAS
jgi:hypothetical protein